MTANRGQLAIKQASELLKSVGLRKTIARIHLLQCLASLSSPRTQAEISELLSPHGFDDSTIFRGLTDLTESGLAIRIDVGDRIWRFELHDRNSNGELADRHHPHAICTQCGCMLCIPATSIDQYSHAVPDWQIENLLLRGTCEKCTANRST